MYRLVNLSFGQCLSLLFTLSVLVTAAPNENNAAGQLIPRQEDSGDNNAATTVPGVPSATQTPDEGDNDTNNNDNNNNNNNNDNDNIITTSIMTPTPTADSMMPISTSSDDNNNDNNTDNENDNDTASTTPVMGGTSTMPMTTPTPTSNGDNNNDSQTSTIATFTGAAAPKETAQAMMALGAVGAWMVGAGLL